MSQETQAPVVVQEAKINVQTLNSVLKYLSTKPFQEVAGLIEQVQKAQIINPFEGVSETSNPTEKKEEVADNPNDKPEAAK